MLPLRACRSSPDSQSVLYEVNLEADADIVAPFDTWLRDHIADMLQFDGFRSAEILDDPSAPAGRIRRIVQYRLRDRAALDDYLANHAPAMRTQGAARFGDRYTAQRRVLPHREELVRGAVSTDNCLNCGEVLTGQHCSHCGQHATVRVLSLWALLKDVLGDLLNADSRVWRTTLAVGVSSGPADAGVPARPPRELHAAVPHVPGAERGVLRDRVVRRPGRRGGTARSTTTARTSSSAPVMARRQGRPQQSRQRRQRQRQLLHEHRSRRSTPRPSGWWTRW